MPSSRKSRRTLPFLAAGVVLGVVIVWSMVWQYSRANASGEGNFATSSTSQFLLAGISRSNAASNVRNHATRRPKLPLGNEAVPSPALEPRVPQITVTKTSAAPAFDRKLPKSDWTFLTQRVRQQIDAAEVRTGRWKTIVIHASGTHRGSAAEFDYYHREVKHMTDGLAYHFVIGNGNGSGQGSVEVGPRWSNQQIGGYLQSEEPNETALGICLVGNFQKESPSLQQLEALDELIDYIQAKVGKIPVTTHRLTSIRPTLCPGKHFPASQFVEP